MTPSRFLIREYRKDGCTVNRKSVDLCSKSIEDRSVRVAMTRTEYNHERAPFDGVAVETGSLPIEIRKRPVRNEIARQELGLRSIHSWLMQVHRDAALPLQ